MPQANTEAMNEHLAEISRCVTAGAYAVLVVDGAGWHTASRLVVPHNLGLLQLPTYAPELNPTETIWEYLRGNFLSHVRRLQPSVEPACRHAGPHPVDRYPSLGAGQSLGPLV